ncbi:hypothetical protein TH63_04315 [Rufibacter radiotolerans]|uniref:Lipoprotein n=1 Tax=Rufibacter radiotolerans TaxID=1379910 RepID=A0A0H4VMM8_9BACT|nr:hypothetical protein [Rufibacter radiotolerans]AKQ45029.1 hypothetical protein TH63_04315 [Rufibacter radiotolerans]
MNRLFLLLAALLFVSCQTDSELFDDVNEMAEFDRVYKPTLIQSGKESRFLEPMMEYSLFTIDSLAFRNLENSIVTSDRFKKGTYYLNIELDDYLYRNNLDILNMAKSSITENKYEKTYHLYLLSDRKTFAICKVNQ